MATAASQLHRTDQEEAEVMENIHEHYRSDPSTTKQEALEKIMDDQTNETQQAKIHDKPNYSMDSATSPLLSTGTAILDTKTIPAGAASGFGMPLDVEVAPELVAPVVISTTTVDEIPTDDGLVVVQEQAAVLAPEDLLPELPIDPDRQQIPDYIGANDDDLEGMVIRAMETADVDEFAAGPGGLLEERWESQVVEIFPSAASTEGDARYHETKEEMASKGQASPH
ncbi:hypothetical protein O6H91_16G073100 [Diphasiastrum complanatum]|uniref:Uncharacterized protein n=1 Tax=Diphasiastrum complanatum TaxID=34168 RepID=A0ACC2BDF8_DIPCM|nr:hypothetical protein O6H91_16G073100 [Diphasiastrum complanatum]